MGKTSGQAMSSLLSVTGAPPMMTRFVSSVWGSSRYKLRRTHEFCLEDHSEGQQFEVGIWSGSLGGPDERRPFRCPPSGE
jgi:hypothetical protein